MIGTRLSHYEITSRLGAGGMGEVYRARDSKLNRDVALKILPESFALDADRVARFKREAQVLASLNHPNIAAIYGIESNALVMELVEGEDLSAHISRGAIPLAEALPIAKQIADALEAAHEQGIIHRDLKPQNIKVRADGTVKVLDFGLAKAGASNASASALANSPTLMSQAMTQMGVILGTAAYMAPEQAKGRVVDKRSDIWAFGVVLYEMLTGTRPFQGEDVSDLLVAVLSKDVDLGALPAATPPAIVTLIRRCLVRDPKKRLRDIGEARLILEDPASLEPAAPSSSSAVTAPARVPVWRRTLPGRRRPCSARASSWRCCCGGRGSPRLRPSLAGCSPASARTPTLSATTHSRVLPSPSRRMARRWPSPEPKRTRMSRNG